LSRPSGRTARRTARRALQVHVSNLRTRLRPHAGALTYDAAGYRLAGVAVVRDLDQPDRHVEAARAARVERDTSAAAIELGAAEAVLRGRLAAELDSPEVMSDRARYEELAAVVREQRLARGRAEPAVGRGRARSGGARGPVPGVRIPSLTVSRSGATAGSQTVVYEHRLHEWVNGGWVLRATERGATVIPAGAFSNSTLLHHVQLPRLVDFNGAGTGCWKMWTNVTWHDSASGRALGGRTLDFNSSSDCACEASRFVFCSVGPGWVRVI
jgi:hypothetical protein